MTAIRTSVLPRLLLALLASGSAAAADRVGAYVGGGIGGGTADIRQGLQSSCFYNIFGNYVCGDADDDLLSLQAQGGYRMSPWFAVEGKIMGAANDGDDGYDELTFGALSVRAVGLLPVSDLVDLYALAGFYTGESEVAYYDSEDENGVVLGGGVQFNIGSRGQFGLRLEYEVYDTDEQLDDVQLFNAAFQYNFF